MSSAFYLKYRPQSLNELIGQEFVKKTLLSAFKENKLAHGYLFVGPRGTGKTSTARILAKMINCEEQESRVKSQESSENYPRLSTLATSDYPCNKCPICISITDGSNLDLIEIDAASNRGIEDIRALREKIKLAPVTGKKKVYIIDEVHMLTAEAFNALLKTLEEPPNHVLFILATTDVNKIPQTILSRVQRLQFNLATQDELLEVIKKITNLEKIDIDDEAMKFLAKIADGSFRDGVKLLDQISSIEGKKNLENLQKSLKTSDFNVNLEFLEVFSKKDTVSALKIVLNQINEGIGVKELISSLMDALRNLLFINLGLGENLVKPNLPEEKYKQLEEKGTKFKVSELTFNLEVLQNSLEKLKSASISSLPLELALVEICGESEKSRQSRGHSIKSVLKVESAKLEESKTRQIIEDKSDIPISNIQLQNTASIIQTPTSINDVSKIKEKWQFVLETIRQSNFSLEALLRSINITNCTEREVVMEVPYTFHQRILETPKNRDLLESILSDILGRSIRISTILGNRPARREDLANVEVAADDEIIRAAVEIFNSSLDS